VTRHAQHAREAREREAVALAHHVAEFSAAADVGKLKPLARYVSAERVWLVD